MNWWREPLLHFLVLGGLIFAWGAWRGAEVERPQRIVVGEAEVARQAALFETAWKRPPTDAELAASVRDHTRQEMLVREARRLGLDAGDEVIRRRLAQKMELLVSDAVPEPTEDELRAHFEANADRYALPARFTFSQTTMEEGDIEEVRADPESYRQRTSLPREMERATLRSVRATFGTDFADVLDGLAPSPDWQGPFASGLGSHLIRLDRVETATPLTFAQARRRVRTDLMAERREAARNAAFARLAQGYEIEIADLP